jgi:tetratricopeptide (TPR) repeat protein
LHGRAGAVRAGLAESLALAGQKQEAIVAVDEGLAIAADSGQAFADPVLYYARGKLLRNAPRRDFAANQACFEQALTERLCILPAWPWGNPVGDHL